MSNPAKLSQALLALVIGCGCITYSPLPEPDSGGDEIGDGSDDSGEPCEIVIEPCSAAYPCPDDAVCLVTPGGDGSICAPTGCECAWDDQLGGCAIPCGVEVGSCPDGLQCAGFGEVNVCVVPHGDACEFVGPCTDNGDCESGTCVRTGDLTASFCSPHDCTCDETDETSLGCAQICNDSSECSDGWGCYSFDFGFWACAVPIEGACEPGEHQCFCDNGLCESGTTCVVSVSSEICAMTIGDQQSCDGGLAKMSDGDQTVCVLPCSTQGDCSEGMMCEGTYCAWPS